MSIGAVIAKAVDTEKSIIKRADNLLNFNDVSIFGEKHYSKRI